MHKTCLLFFMLVMTAVFFFTAGKASADWSLDTKPPTITHLQLNPCYTSGLITDPLSWTAAQPIHAAQVKDNLSGVQWVEFIITNITTPASSPPHRVFSPLVDTNYGYSFPTSDLVGGIGSYRIEAKAMDGKNNETVGYLPSSFSFTYQLVCPSQQWIKTTVGDVHSNNKINTPGGPL